MVRVEHLALEQDSVRLTWRQYRHGPRSQLRPFTRLRPSMGWRMLPSHFVLPELQGDPAMVRADRRPRVCRPSGDARRCTCPCGRSVRSRRRDQALPSPPSEERRCTRRHQETNSMPLISGWTSLRNTYVPGSSPGISYVIVSGPVTISPTNTGSAPSEVSR